jgi:hypothetical protein
MPAPRPTINTPQRPAPSPHARRPRAGPLNPASPSCPGCARGAARLREVPEVGARQLVHGLVKEVASADGEGQAGHRHKHHLRTNTTRARARSAPRRGGHLGRRLSAAVLPVAPCLTRPRGRRAAGGVRAAAYCTVREAVGGRVGKGGAVTVLYCTVLYCTGSGRRKGREGGRGCNQVEDGGRGRGRGRQQLRAPRRAGVSWAAAATPGGRRRA